MRDFRGRVPGKQLGAVPAAAGGPFDKCLAQIRALPTTEYVVRQHRRNSRESAPYSREFVALAVACG